VERVIHLVSRGEFVDTPETAPLLRLELELGLRKVLQTDSNSTDIATTVATDAEAEVEAEADNGDEDGSGMERIANVTLRSLQKHNIDNDAVREYDESSFAPLSAIGKERVAFSLGQKEMETESAAKKRRMSTSSHFTGPYFRFICM